MSSSSTSTNSTKDLQSLHGKIHDQLRAFASSSSTFHVVHTVPESCPSPSQSQPAISETLYVLDSSFNPPTHAHSTIARNALLKDHGAATKNGGLENVRLMLLLATENADKKPKPASFEDRLVMMTIMARQLRASMASHTGENPKGSRLTVDVAITKKPFFMDKAASIDESNVYGPHTQQVHLTGYDTLIRIFDSKYYPQDKRLRVLEPFLSRHRLRVCYRVSVNNDADRREQERYVEAIGDGSRADEGMKTDWKDQVELVDDAKEVRSVSSTQARKAAVELRKEDLEALVDEEMAKYVTERGLYEGEGAVKKSYD